MLSRAVGTQGRHVLLGLLSLPLGELGTHRGRLGLLRMKRSPMPPRTSRLARGPKKIGKAARIRIRRRKRPESEFHRVYGGKRRIAFVKSLPCIVAGPECSGAIENAHAENGGMGRKADASSVFPCCGGHHGLLHRQGVRWFQSHYAVSLSEAAATTQRLWEAHCA